jgi:hypothetical protein
MTAKSARELLRRLGTLPVIQDTSSADASAVRALVQVVRMLLDRAVLVTDGKIPADVVPDMFNDVEEFPTRADFPAAGEEGKLYADLSTGMLYRWSAGDSDYVVASDMELLRSLSRRGYIVQNEDGTVDAVLPGDSEGE